MSTYIGLFLPVQVHIYKKVDEIEGIWDQRGHKFNAHYHSILTVFFSNFPFVSYFSLSITICILYNFINRIAVQDVYISLDIAIQYFRRN